MRANPTGVSFSDVIKVCEHYFGKVRVSGSHHIFKTPWQGDPRVNLQKQKNGKAKGYQVRQVLLCIDRFSNL